MYRDSRPAKKQRLGSIGTSMNNSNVDRNLYQMCFLPSSSLNTTVTISITNVTTMTVFLQECSPPAQGWRRRRGRSLQHVILNIIMIIVWSWWRRGPITPPSKKEKIAGELYISHETARVVILLLSYALLNPHPSPAPPKQERKVCFKSNFPETA